MTLLELVTDALSKVNDPELRHPITELGMIEDLSEVSGSVSLKVLLTIAACPMQDRLRTDISNAVTSVEGVKSVDLVFGVMNEEQRNFVKKVVRGGREKFIPFAQPDSLTRVIGIASGKGGVGKSSVTANLAVAMAKNGLNVGILDADVYGHSIPRLMGLMGQRPTAIDQMFIPLESYGVKTVSMEMFKPERSDPVAYRGPLLHRVLEQLLSDAYWGDLDVLLIDLPPGTGDIHLTLSQRVPITGAVIVTTPQEVALMDARKGLRMFEKVSVPVLGIIENMALHTCTNCGHVEHIFGSGGAQTMATDFKVPLLGSLPLDMRIRRDADDGRPTLVSDPDGEVSGMYTAMARQLSVSIAKLGKDMTSKFPKIVVQAT